MLRNFKNNMLKRNKTLHKIYYKICGQITHKSSKQKNAYLKKNGIKTLAHIQKMLLESELKFFVDMGTLLGIVRDNQFLSHDIDIDIAVYTNNEEDKSKLHQRLLHNKCKLKYTYIIDGLGIIEQSYLLNNIKIDINYYFQVNNFDVCYLMYRDPNKEYKPTVMDVVKLTCSPIKEIKTLKFQNIKVNCPSEPEKYLAERYGERWKIPDKEYIYWKGPSTHDTSYIGHQIAY